LIPHIIPETSNQADIHWTRTRQAGGGIVLFLNRPSSRKS
jgi:hypothetical protein